MSQFRTMPPEFLASMLRSGGDVLSSSCLGSPTCYLAKGADHTCDCTMDGVLAVLSQMTSPSWGEDQGVRGENLSPDPYEPLAEGRRCLPPLQEGGRDPPSGCRHGPVTATKGQGNRNEPSNSQVIIKGS